MMGRGHVFAGLLALLVSSGCTSGDDGPGQGPGFVLTADEEGNTTLEVAGKFTWWQNAIHDDDYVGWSTQFNDEAWEGMRSRMAAQIRQEASGQMAATVELDAEHRYELEGVVFGIGWRSLQPLLETEPVVNLEALDMHPTGDSFHAVDFTDCDVTQSRILFAFSNYSEPLEDLWAIAEESAAAAGQPAPEDWYDVVRDPAMYDLLFIDNRVLTMDYATFAFVSVQLDPVCDGIRLTYRTESELVGPVERVEAEDITHLF